MSVTAVAHIKLFHFIPDTALIPDELFSFVSVGF